MLEIRIDGDPIASDLIADTAIPTAFSLKREHPHRVVSLHDRQFERCWIVDSECSLSPQNFPRDKGQTY